MPRSPSLLLTCAVALLLGGCDRQTAPPAQPAQADASEAAEAGDAEALDGKLDRSFAGTPMPVATLAGPGDTEIELAALKGKPVLLNLWATWCAPCVVEMPLLDRIASELKDQLQVVTVSEDLTGLAAVEPFFAQRNFANLPQWVDPKNELAVAFGGGAALPLTVLYDAEGNEVWRVMGGYDWAGAEARQRIAEVLKET